MGHSLVAIFVEVLPCCSLQHYLSVLILSIAQVLRMRKTLNSPVPWVSMFYTRHCRCICRQISVCKTGSKIWDSRGYRRTASSRPRGRGRSLSSCRSQRLYESDTRVLRVKPMICSSSYAPELCKSMTFRDPTSGTKDEITVASPIDPKYLISVDRRSQAIVEASGGLVQRRVAFEF